MDTIEKYRDADYYIRLAGDKEPEWVKKVQEKRVNKDGNNIVGWNDKPLRDHHQLNEDVPIDGIVTFYSPDKVERGEAFMYFHFPFRSINKDEYSWFARPDSDKWSKHPVWKWKNPDEPLENITLNPSLGIGGEDELRFHCYIRDGEIDWL